MNDYQAKESAIGSLRGQQYVNHGAGISNAQAPCPPSSATVASEIISRMENLHCLLKDILISQRNLMERLHGPRPETPSNEAKVVQPQGLLGTIDERLNWLSHTAQEISSNQMTLDRLA